MNNKPGIGLYWVRSLMENTPHYILKKIIRPKGNNTKTKQLHTPRLLSGCCRSWRRFRPPCCFHTPPFARRASNRLSAVTPPPRFFRAAPLRRASQLLLADEHMHGCHARAPLPQLITRNAVPFCFAFCFCALRLAPFHN